MSSFKDTLSQLGSQYLQPVVMSAIAFMSPAKAFIVLVQLLVLFEVITWEFARKRITEKVVRTSWWILSSLYVIALLMARVFEIAFADLWQIPWVNVIGLAILLKQARDINRNIKAITGFDFYEEIVNQISKLKSTKKDG